MVGPHPPWTILSVLQYNFHTELDDAPLDLEWTSVLGIVSNHSATSTQADTCITVSWL